MIQIARLLLILVLAGCASPDDTEQAGAIQPPLAVKASGELASDKPAVLGPPAVSNIWNYTISFMLPEGTNVTEGMLVLSFNDQEIQVRLTEKSGELKQKQSELERGRLANVEALDKLRLRGEELKMMADKAGRKADLPRAVVAGNSWKENQLNQQRAVLEFDNNTRVQQKKTLALQTEERILESDINRLTLEVKELSDAIERMMVKAPKAGMVMHLADWNGNKFSVGDQIWGGIRVIELPDLQNMILKLEIDERDLNRVRPGQKLTFRLDANPEREFQGEIIRLADIVRTRSRRNRSGP